MSKFLYRLGQFSVGRHRLVLLAWVVLLVGVGVAGSAAGGETTDTFSIPGTESQEAIDLLEARFPSQSGSDARVVFAAPEGESLIDGANAEALAATTDQLAQLPEVSNVAGPEEAGTISPDGQVAFATVSYDVGALEVEESSYQALTEVAAEAEEAGLTVELGGRVVASNEQPEPASSELIGLGVAVIVLLFAFGSVLAMGLPLLTALIGLGTGLGGITLLSAFVDLSSTAPILATMIGLAVGIDYALFIITRHRANLRDGHSVEEAAARANATAGSAVVFAGLTVVVAIGGLAVVGIPFLTVMGLAAAGTVLIAVLVAVSLLPAMLGFVGTNIDRFKLPGMAVKASSEGEDTLGTRWAGMVTRRPVIALVGGLLVMGVLALPALDLRLGMADAGTKPESSTQRRAYDLLADGFGPGFNGPLTVVVDLTGAADRDGAVARVSDAIAADDNVNSVTPPRTNQAGNTAVLNAIPGTGPADKGTESLIHRLRDDDLTGIEADTGAAVSITGSTASNIDISDKLGGALPTFMVLVIGLILVLLLVAFRSILVPIKAGIAILTSIGASFGVLVAIFQWGWLKDLIGLETTVPIISFLPMMMFAILFGLSMDYEVFIMSRIREEYVRSDDPKGSVITGLAASARVITAAAIIMISVFAAFVLGEDPTIKMFGVGLAVAVFLDATVVRMVLVPAVLTLLDRTAWWLPAWLDRITPDVDIEGEHLMAELEATDDESAGDDDDLDEDDRVLTQV